ncbi:MAG TPA: hypothetical protein VF937_01320 [Chloroflexota bacterium]
MVIEGPGSTMGRSSVIAACVVATCLVAPLLAPEVWSGFRLAQSDPLLAVIAASEQPLSVRSPSGTWAMLVALAWFSVASWQRRLTGWEAALVMVGGAVALTRSGNAWLFALAMLVPLGRQLLVLRPPLTLAAGVVGLSLVVATFTLISTRPPALPTAADRAALAAGSGLTGKVFTDWRWAPGLQRQMGEATRVLASAGLTSEPAAYWLDYVRIIQGHERWSEALRRLDVDLVVLDAAGDARPPADLVRQSEAWHVVYDTDGVLVAERVSP